MERKQNSNITGRWITTPEFAGRKPVNVFHRQLEPMKEQKSGIENRHILFRKKFTINNDESILSALIRITADDYYKLYINGSFVSQGPCPGYHFHYYYNTLDVSGFLKTGENLIAVHTYYQGLINRVWVSGDDRHGLLLDLAVNEKIILQSDESFLWQQHSGFSALGKAGNDTQFLEQYDSASPETGFEQVGFDDRQWSSAVYNARPDWITVPQPTPQLDFETIKPRALTKTAHGYLADFGGVYVGYFLLKAHGKKGQQITLLYGQELQDNGSVRFELRANCHYQETWLLSGGEDCLNQFDYKSFRYVELIAPPDDCVIDETSFFIAARHYPFSLKAQCNSDDPKLRAVWDLCVNSLRYGVQEVIQDCMEREKGQYLGDGCYTAIAYGVLTGDFALFEKLIREALRSAFVSPGLLTCVPGSFMQEIVDYPLYVPFACMLYFQYTGNIEFLREVFPGLKSMLDHYRASYATENGLLNNLDDMFVVEWPPNMRDGYDVDEEELKPGHICKTLHNVINAQYIGAGKFLNKMAALLGEPAVIDTAPLIKAFQAAFYDEKSGLFKDSVNSAHISIPGNAYPLMLNLCPDKRSEQNLIAYIRERRLSGCMLFITYVVFSGLVRAGETALLNELIADDGAWLRMIDEGATTTFEAWGKDLKWNTSLFHLCLSYAAQFLTDWGMEKVFEGI